MLSGLAVEMSVAEAARDEQVFLRWRPDRDPASCRFDQIHVASGVRLAEFLASAGGQ